ncbi:nuclear GTPase SLIP-GC-like [Parambassis ranga]|uniref:Nuclear GTPase SLIP-GC-like n=1 Tax=Parambassis ranga TaxID=210632 RepID=A0A6P7IRK8_9TELE|nr:nuclear GTPase SLIP-GC-like [Parambassis ranga]XP_028268244.1 nuclear GTPase SLIP-GC-like [Parambassis ranga]
MDDFVCSKLTEWGLEDWIDRFKEQRIDKESLYLLKDKEDVEKLFSKVGPKLKFKKRLQRLQNEQKHAEDDAQVRPSTSGTAKRKLDLQGESSKGQSPTSKRQRESTSGPSSDEHLNMQHVKKIMGRVNDRLQTQQPTNLNKFLKTKIEELKEDKRELVGVFGKTGAGKSSLINAVLGEKNLLPSGSLRACTSVMIKVEANMDNSEYVAEIEFITKEEWITEVWDMSQFVWNADHKRAAGAAAAEDKNEYSVIEEKLSALYGEEWKQKIQVHENLMNPRYFREIPEFLNLKMKTLSADTAKELSEQFAKYTRTNSKQGGNKEERWYWPLVKSVTVKVPNNDLLQHVTLVDLPGNGDRNKSRDEMWKEIVGDCSAVWIVTEINRAASETEAWEILDGVTSLIGNGGQCQNIHFICTKSDCIEEADDNSTDTVHAGIKKRNTDAKEEVNSEFRKQNHIRTHFSEDTFEVFTVSSKEFLQRKYLEKEDTEIPKLQEFLKNLNDSHSETVNYVSGAHGILSLIQGARCRDGTNTNTEVCAELENNMKHRLQEVEKVIEETYKAFKECLDEGVKKSRSSCEKELKFFLNPSGGGSAFHGTLTCVVRNGGIHKPKKGALIDLNMKLSSHLTGSIDKEFRNTFPQQTKGQCGPFNGVINSFSLGTEGLIEKYKDVELQLIFLKTEEDKMKTTLNQMIRDKKKLIYRSVTETIKTNMQTSYEKAATFSGQGILDNMRFTLQKHVHDSKDTMFKQAGETMLKKLKDLKKEILDTLKKTMMESIELSLKTDDHSIPDVSAELVEVKKYYNELCSSQDEEH